MTLLLERGIFYEEYDDAGNAIQREKQLKDWTRKWKINLIERDNPDWIGLYEDICT